MGGIELAPLLTKLKVDITGFKDSMAEATNVAVTKADEISKKLSGIKQKGKI